MLFGGILSEHGGSRMKRIPGSYKRVGRRPSLMGHKDARQARATTIDWWSGIEDTGYLAMDVCIFFEFVETAAAMSRGLLEGGRSKAAITVTSDTGPCPSHSSSALDGRTRGEEGGCSRSSPVLENHSHPLRYSRGPAPLLGGISNQLDPHVSLHHGNHRSVASFHREATGALAARR